MHKSQVVQRFSPSVGIIFRHIQCALGIHGSRIEAAIVKGVRFTVEPVCLVSVLITASKEAQHPEANESKPDEKRNASMLEKRIDSLCIYWLRMQIYRINFGKRNVRLK